MVLALATATKKAMNQLGIVEALNGSVNRGATDMAPLVTKLKAAGIQVVYWGGYAKEGSLLVKQMRAAGVGATLIGADGLNSPEFATLGGSTVEGTLMTNFPDAQLRPEARTIIARFVERKVTPDSDTLNSYAALQIAAAAIGEAKAFDTREIAELLRGGKPWPSVIGLISFDKKGDITRPDFVMYTWKKDATGAIKPVEN